MKCVTFKKLLLLRNLCRFCRKTFQNRTQQRFRKMGEKGATSWSVALAAGGAAGTSVDVALFPLDTVKTRLQSDAGFWRYVELGGRWEF